MKFPVTEAWTNAYTLSGITPGSELAIKPATDHVFTISKTGTGSAEVFW